MVRDVSSGEGSDEQVYHVWDRGMRRVLDLPSIEALLKLVAPEFAGLVDFGRAVVESRTFVSELLRERESDVLVRVPFRETAASKEITICVLVEHQSSVDAVMAVRILTYMVEIWHRELRAWNALDPEERQGSQRLSPILPIVLYTGSQRWTAPLSMAEVLNAPEVLERFVPKFETLLLDVKASERETLRQSESLLGWLLSVLREDMTEKNILREVLAEAVPEINQVPGTQVSQRREILRYLILLIIHQYSRDDQTELIELVERYSPNEMGVTHMAQTAAQSLIEQGAREMSIESTLRILTGRFPSTDVSLVESRLEAIEDLDRLRELNFNASIARSFHAFREELEAAPTA